MSDLVGAASAAAGRAYAPYSDFRVGAAGRTASGQVLAAANVENVSYGLSLCAETALVAVMVASGETELAEVVCADSDGKLLAPCGRCRQVLYEFGGEALIVNGRPLSELLPDAFGPGNLS